jgi:hypothetical protein
LCRDVKAARKHELIALNAYHVFAVSEFDAPKGAWARVCRLEQMITVAVQYEDALKRWAAALSVLQCEKVKFDVLVGRSRCYAGAQR